nr:reverse transcriptase domain-containing protein [Tanacetum cinerariifolium]
MKRHCEYIISTKKYKKISVITRSQSRHNSPQQKASPVIVEPLRIELPFLEDQFQEDPPPESPMADNQTMAELLQAPTEVYEDAIIIPEIAANNFELKHGLIKLVQNKQFFEHDKEDPHAHILVAKVSTRSSTPAISSKVVELKNLVRALLLDKNNQSSASTLSPTPALVKAVEPNRVTCDGTHSYQNCPATSGNVYRDNIQEYVSQSAVANYNQGNNVFRTHMVANQIRPPGFPHHQNNQNNFNRGNNFNQNRGGNFNQSNFNQGGNFNQGQLHRPQVNQPPAYQAPIPQIQNVSNTDFESYIKANDAILRNMQSQGQRSGTLRSNTITNPKEELKGITTRSGVAYQGLTNSTPSKGVLSLPELTPTCMTLELTDRSVSKPIGIAKDVSFKVVVFHFPADFVVVDFEPDPRVLLILRRCFLKTGRALVNVHKEGDILLLETILNSEPLPPLPNHEQYMPSYKKELKVCEAKTVKPSVDEPPEVELKDLPPHLEYTFLEGNNKLPVIIAKELGGEEKSTLIKNKILMEEDYKPAVQHQRRVNPKIYDVIKKEVEKILDAGLIYLISDSSWVCIDYRKLNEATCKDNFPLPFMDQMLERLAGNEFYCFLDGFFGCFQIPIDPHNQEKTTFTCPYGTFAYRRMPFGLCNAPGTFQRCMLAIFHDMVEKTMKVFMDDFLVFGNSIENCLSCLDKMLQWCEDTNLSLNWEKSHFMVKEGIVLGHKISKNGIEVDRAKVNVIAKLPHPTTVKGVRSFLGHANFYQ